MKHEKTKERENHTVSQPPRRTNTNPFLALLTLNMPLHLLLDNHPLALIVIARNRNRVRCLSGPHHRHHRSPLRRSMIPSSREARRSRSRGRLRLQYRPMRNPRMILPILPEIVALALAYVCANRRLPAATAPFLGLSLRRRCCCRRTVAARALHGAQSVRATFFAARMATAADLRACDHGFTAHGSEAGEKGGEEGTQAGYCRGHDRVEDFGLAADRGCDAVEGWVRGVEFLGLVVDLEGGGCYYSARDCVREWSILSTTRYMYLSVMRETYGNLKPKAKMTLVLFETAVWRPQTMYTTMLNSPTSVAMSRPTITLH
jgi:hypothetical protein